MACSKNWRAQKSNYLDADERPHIHLLDGGLADNLGLRSPLEAVFMQDGAWTLAQRVGIADVRKVVFIVVNASTVDCATTSLVPIGSLLRGRGVFADKERSSAFPRAS